MNRNHQYALRTVVTTVAGIFFMAGVSVVSAATPSSDTGSTISANASLADLDLSKPADVAIARERIDHLAHKLCNRFEDPLSLSHQPDYVACLADAVAKAEPRLQRLAAARTSKVRLAELQQH
jgi:UrcA family protein